MRAFLNDSAVKTEFLTQAGNYRTTGRVPQNPVCILAGIPSRQLSRAHPGGAQFVAFDAIGRGIQSRRYVNYETELGITSVLATLQDAVHLGLKDAEADAWMELFLSSIPVGADLREVPAQFATWLLDDAEEGIIPAAEAKGCLGNVPTMVNRSRTAVDSSPESEWGAVGLVQFAVRTVVQMTATAAASNFVKGGKHATARDAAQAAVDEAVPALYKRMADKLIELVAAAPNA